MSDTDLTLPPEVSSPSSRRSMLGAAGDMRSKPATKQFAVNATGNLFVASTLNSISPDSNDAGQAELSEKALQAFGQVSVFFAAMTKAIALEGKSIYDQEALSSVIRESGMFVQVSKSDIDFTSHSYGITFSNEMIQAIMGMSGDLASIGESLFSLLRQVGREGFKVSQSSTEKNTKVGSIIFVCEYLLGAISISPMLVYMDAKEAEDELTVGPCLKSEASTASWKISRETFLFVPPVFMKEAGTINQAMEDPEFLKLVSKMTQGLQKDNETQDKEEETKEEETKE